MAEGKSDATIDVLEVVSVEFIDDGETIVFDISVDVDESFIVAGAIVHNCTVCGALDQQEFPLDKGPRPPKHPRCRCVTTPVLKGEFAALQQGGSRPSIGDRDVKQVSAKLGYYDWLKTQPASFQDFALGPTRGKLLRNGGLTSSQFARLQLDKRFMPMSLAESRILDPLAFDKAGV